MSGTFPIEYAEKLPSGETGQARASLDIPADQTGRAVSQFGAVIFGISQNIQNAKKQVDLSRMKREYDQIMYSAYETFSNTPDAKSREKIIQQALTDTKGIYSEYKSVQGKFEEHYNDTIEGWRNNFKVKHNAIEKQNVKDEALVNIQHSLENGDFKEAQNGYANLRNNLIISQAEYEKSVDDIPVNSTLAQAIILADKDPDGAIAMVSELTSLDVDQTKQKQRVIAFANGVKNRNTAQLDDLQDEQRMALYEKAYIKNEPLDWEEIKATILDADDKIRFWNNYQKAQAEKVETGISQIEEGNPIVLARVTAVVDLRPNDITPAQLYALADEGLGTKHIPGLVNRLKTNQASKNPVTNKYRAELSRLHTAGIFGKMKKTKTSDTYMDLSRKLDTFLAVNPTEEQAQKFFSTLIKDDIHWLFLGDNLPGWEERPLGIELETKEGEKREFEINFGDIIEIDGQYQQAIGRKDGKVIWLEVNPR